MRHISDAEVKRGTRLTAIALLQQAESAFPHLSRDPDTEALHDFRVALRRLRSHVQTYRGWLRESVDRKQERRLRRIARASNVNRDLQVLLEHLADLPLDSKAAAAGARLLERQLRVRLEEETQTFRTQALAGFPTLARELLQGLSSYTADLHMDGGADQRMGEVAARLTAQLGADVRAQLAAVQSVEHQQEAHEARIAGKKLRYLLEPFAEEIEACASAVDGLKQFQDALGRLHDTHMLLTEVETTLHSVTPEGQGGLVALLEEVREQRSSAFATVRQEYLASHAALLWESVSAAEHELARGRQSRRIERRFLLKRMPRLRDATAQTIQQGYLPGAAIHECVHSIESSVGHSYYRTVRTDSGAGEIEVEEETSERIFKKLYALTKGQRVRVRRYAVEENALRWQIDRFRDRKLVLALLTVESADQPLEFPRWLKTLVVREVTGDPEYTNEHLAC